jgi:hypothetical protein
VPILLFGDWTGCSRCSFYRWNDGVGYKAISQGEATEMKAVSTTRKGAIPVKETVRTSTETTANPKIVSQQEWEATR